eukprot:CAMPEP_0115339672 /NCGR_PEP_ID=MMETSP0270-20121206/90740_1 /TAXON_ID=71861 /ORGANISM="Scrippsiella trochoidea, Strain CCMP3099" /LENGTH=39 /DNA_ID= /DNA_START= /DNA_END= /DNA_ORIENTATION=
MPLQPRPAPALQTGQLQHPIWDRRTSGACASGSPHRTVA